MIHYSRLCMWAITIILLCSATYGTTITFDEVPSGTLLAGSSYYNDNYRVWFAAPFQAISYTELVWAIPHSGNNVFVWSDEERELLPYGGSVSFGYVTPAWAVYDLISSVGAYFSTQTGVMIRMTM